MTVTLTSEAYGQQPGTSFTGTAAEEDWLLANGYARKAGYTGPGVANTGPSDVVPSKEVTDAANREAPPGYTGGAVAGYDGDAAYDVGPLDPALDLADGHPKGYEPARSGIYPPYDFDAAGLNDEAPVVNTVTPPTGLVAGGTVVTLKGTGFKRTTAVTFGDTAGTALKIVSDSELRVTTPAHAAGAVAVVATNPVGSGTKANGFTYTS